MTLLVSGGERGVAFERALQSLVSNRFASRLFAQDATLWGPDAESEARVRLGWVEAGAQTESLIDEVEQLRHEFLAIGVDRFVLCGMGGSSLAPLVIAGSNGGHDAAPGLTVLDSTHPDSVRALTSHELQRTAVVVSSKSGSTLETRSHRLRFAAAFRDAGINPNERIVIVTDPGSALEQEASESGERVFLADPNVGGRFSALTAFGIVPSVLAGVDMRAIVAEALSAREAYEEDSAENPALTLAALIAAGLPERFVLELYGTSEGAAHLGLWIEQLIAESTGKAGTGVLPIAMPYGLEAEAGAQHAPAVQTARITLSDTETLDRASNDSAGALTIGGGLGAQFLLWESATAALGHLLKVDAFDQPDVESAKVAARDALSHPADDGDDDVAELTVSECAARIRDAVDPSGYVAIQAYVDSTDAELGQALEELQSALIRTFGVPVSLGFGPRYLHSTGQFHKGGRPLGSFLQLVDTPRQDLEIPGEPMTFGELMHAQASGDASVLRARGNTVTVASVGNAHSFVRELIHHLSQAN